ncbi:FAD-dependent oxidoreductase [Solwaraspora sp. WMMD1047]|uniref:protoporphyrinogen/coproporphyrinogen oxidase n=1 Tax=Solwaraspora sp. WMMD1047 TaxID=3016102 RepID=UPI0024166D74|nr:FAD-dependent oxidoreductase [Solwaraspora sp. WMMD1047]MDG4829849.1 FAD-dependent oxidoreductase [Solwaraspora sp. WMMD1047]
MSTSAGPTPDPVRPGTVRAGAGHPGAGRAGAGRFGPRIAVVGGGVTGLAAALRLRDRAPAGSEITVYEQSAALGGKLSTGELAGSAVEFGAEAFLVRDPTGADSAAVALARRLGLGGDLVHPVVGRAAIVVGGELRPIPAGTLVGVPGDLAAVAAVARPAADADRDGGRPLLGPDEDVAVGALVRDRLGDEVADRLVDPMLGGVYAGRADDLSLAATMPALARTARTEPTLTGAVRAALAAAPRTAGAPVFATVSGGLGRLVTAIEKALTDPAGAPAPATGDLAGPADGDPTDPVDGGPQPPGGPVRIRLGAAVRELSPTPTGWRLVVGPTRGAELVEADAVLLALPARPAARLLAGLDTPAAGLVGALDYASVALVTLLLPPDAAGRLPALSGFLVPAAERTLIKAATFFTTKWGARPDGRVLLRASIGRYGEEQLLHRPDEELAATAHRELAGLLGGLPAPQASQVRRWGGALPQYRPGHLGRVATARDRLRATHPTIALAGAGYDGVGIPACVRSGEAAAEEIITSLGGWTA